ncbi:hypothetical protein [Nocardia suismassiliense]|uniref:hypothetical protein n=1 Tax=Nocardia suismassiliense TaxID=2077092 RepID=UPI000D1E22F2|nr:hypothetical protein [Nocardia suismassiliense]
MSHLHEALVTRAHLADIPSTRWHACKSVLRCIAEHANEASADTAWPGVELMMLETGMSESAVVRTTTLLAAHGWITKTRRYGTSNLYRLNMAKLRAHQIAKPAPKAVHMSEHLPALLFPGEDLHALVAELPTPGARPRPGPHRSLVPGRSVAAVRAARRNAAAEPVHPIVDLTEEPQVRISHVDSTYSPDPDPAPHPNTSDRRVRTRRSDVNHHVDPTNEPAGKDQRTHKQRATTGTANARVPASSAPATTGARAGRALMARLELGWHVVEPSAIRVCAPGIEARLDQGGWTPEALTASIEARFAAAVADMGGPAQVRNPPGLLIKIVRDLPATAVAATVAATAVAAPGPARLPWCEQCEDPDHRWITHILDEGTPAERRASGRCPRCHPSAGARTAQLVNA